MPRSALSFADRLWCNHEAAKQQTNHLLVSWVLSKAGHELIGVEDDAGDTADKIVWRLEQHAGRVGGAAGQQLQHQHAMAFQAFCDFFERNPAHPAARDFFSRAFGWYASKGELTVLKNFVSNYHVHVDSLDYGGATALMRAADNSRAYLVDASQQTSAGFAADTAASHDCALWLLEQRADVGIVTGAGPREIDGGFVPGSTALHIAATRRPYVITECGQRGVRDNEVLVALLAAWDFDHTLSTVKDANGDTAADLWSTWSTFKSRWSLNEDKFSP